jgi:hypothetical protein
MFCLIWSSFLKARLTLRRAQHGVQVLAWNAIGQQRDLEGVLGALAQPALAREALGVPKSAHEVGPLASFWVL